MSGKISSFKIFCKNAHAIDLVNIYSTDAVHERQMRSWRTIFDIQVFFQHNTLFSTEQSSRSGTKIWIWLKNVLKHGKSLITFTNISKARRLKLYLFQSLRGIDILTMWFSIYEFVLQVQNIKGFKTCF